MHKQILESSVVFIDETPLDMQDPGKGKVHQAYMWTLVGGKGDDPPYRVYKFYRDRKHEHAKKMLSGYKHLVVHSDKYGAYETLANNKEIIWCPCWAHIRRKFFEAEETEFRRWMLMKIGHLFKYERVAWARSPEERLKIRQEKESKIVDELTAAIKQKLTDGKLLAKSKLRQALGYYCGLIPYLKNYQNYPYAHLDNNIAERAIRPLAIGRKNWLFVGNEDGGEAAAIILSLVQSCRAIKVNPRMYLEDVMRRQMSHPANRIEELLPDRWLEEQRQVAAMKAVASDAHSK